jgi:Rrf2 family protein
MAHLGASVEYAVHCLLWLVGREGQPLSSRELATLQGISPSFVAKIFPKLEKAQLVTAAEGAAGGYSLAREPEKITFLDIVDAVEGRKPLFDCQEIRGKCAIFEGCPPVWATRGTCSVHSVMLKVEKAMRAELSAHTLADVAAAVDQKAPPNFFIDVDQWIEEQAENQYSKRASSRTRKRER